MEKLRPVLKAQLLLFWLWIAAMCGLFCWLVFHQDWLTPEVLDMSIPLRHYKLQHYMQTGLWLGSALALLMSLLLGVNYIFWGGKRAFTVVRLKSSTPPQLNTVLFFILLLVIVTAAGYIRWPAMKHSFWGDESWAVCDYVHGKWKPVHKDETLQDEIYFKQCTWDQTLFADHNGNNHWLASILQRSALNLWQKAGDHAPWEFNEVAVRSISLCGGLASLVALALLLRRLGRPLEGLLAAGILALHPWHVRFSVEARGYGLMLFFFVLMFYALVNALEHNRKRDWMWLGMAQFFTLYTWKGAVYPLCFINLVVGIVLCTRHFPQRGDRLTVISRWLAANMLGAMLFLPLALPSQLQVRKSMDDLRGRAKPMGKVWAHNIMTGVLTGMPYHEEDRDNPHEVSLQKIRRQDTWRPLGHAGVVAFTVMGLGVWMRRSRVIAAIFSGVLLSALTMALHFKYGLHVELLHWYLLYVVPIVTLLSAAGIMSAITWMLRFLYVSPAFKARAQSASLMHSQHSFYAMALCLSFTIWAYQQLWSPAIHEVRTRAKEDHKGAWLATRGHHEAPGFHEHSRIYTAWLWRHAFLYDPRGDVYVRDENTLLAKMNEATACNGEFYMIIGNSELCDLLCPGMMKMLRNPDKFQQVQTLWGMEKLNTLYIYQMKKPPAARTLVIE